MQHQVVETAQLVKDRERDLEKVQEALQKQATAMEDHEAQKQVHILACEATLIRHRLLRILSAHARLKRKNCPPSSKV